MGRHLLNDLALDLSPLALYSFQEASGNPQDISGNGRHFTSVTSTPDYQQTGEPNLGDYAVFMNGGEGFVRSSVLSTIVNDFTMELILSVTNVTANSQQVLENGVEASSGWGINMESSGVYRGLAGGVAFQANGSTIEGAGWKMIHVCRDSADSSRWKYSEDGVETNSNAGTSTPNTPATSFSLGDGSIAWYIAHLAVYGSCLSATRRTMHFDAWKSRARREMLVCS